MSNLKISPPKGAPHGEKNDTHGSVTPKQKPGDAIFLQYRAKLISMELHFFTSKLYIGSLRAKIEDKLIPPVLTGVL